MAIKLRTKRPDRVLKRFVEVLKQYDAAHPQAEIEAYRHNSVSVRIRIIDTDFEGKDYVLREDEIWPLLKPLPDETVAELSLLLLFTPEEAKKSFANAEFDDPIPSRI